MRARVLGPLPLVLWLTVVWTGLWGSITWANVLGGLAVSLALVLLLPLAAVPGRPVIAPVALLRFAGHFVTDLFVSSWQVAFLAVRLRTPLRQAVVAVPVRGASDGLLTLLADAISLTPGTLTLEVDRPRSTLYVHVLDVGPGTRSVDAVRQSILQVERLAVLAIGSDEARRALAEDEGRVRR